MVAGVMQPVGSGSAAPPTGGGGGNPYQVGGGGSYSKGPQAEMAPIAPPDGPSSAPSSGGGSSYQIGSGSYHTGPQSESAPTTAAIYPSTGGGQLPQIGSGATAQADPSSPTGGYVNINPNVGAGINTGPSALLPGGFNVSQLGVPQQSTSTADPSSYVTAGESQMKGPTTWNITPDQTVAGQFAKLTGEGGGQLNPAIQQAEQAMIRSSAAHGGANDTMSQLAATEAGNNLALSVAQADASVNAQAGQFNATQANAFNENLNQFVENAQLSGQNFQQALSTLNAQTNQQLNLLTANVNANAANTSIGLNASIANTQASLNSTLAAMGQSYNYQTAQQYTSAGIANAQQWTQYGMQVRLGYLQGVQQQANALQQEIANISSNPNITPAQAQGAMQDAINQFNTLTTQLGSYSAAMMPSQGNGTASGAYSTPAYNYSYINPSSWPGPSTTGTGGGSASNGFFLNPSALNSQTASIAPASNPATAATSQTGGHAGGGSGGNVIGYQGNMNPNGNSVYSFQSGSTGQIFNNIVMRGDPNALAQPLQQQGYTVSNGQVSDQSGQSLGSLGDFMQGAKDLITGAASNLQDLENSSIPAKVATAIITHLFPALGIINAGAKLINLAHNHGGVTAPIPGGGGGNGASLVQGDVYNYGQQLSGGNNSGNGGFNELGGGNLFTGDTTGTQSGDSSVASGTGAPMQGYLDNGSYQTGNLSEWDGSMAGGNAGGHIWGEVGGAEAE